jgi:alkanesulfonate monooxygenase SsuD/methylene tetrahydromethanopterin reductase-like flavin-dependent oxidoreductase (luciferase family)
VKIGLALPQYDYSVAGERPLRFETILEYAELAARAGFTSVWLSDHLYLDLAKYGGSDRRDACFEPLVTLAAIARHVPDIRVGTLVLLEALRPAAVLAKALASLDRVSDGRLDVGLGAGWYEPEYTDVGMEMPPPRERLERLAEAVDIVKGLLDGGPLVYDGRHHRAAGADNHPPAVQSPRPRVFVGGSGDKLLRLAALHADGWNTCWKWTPESYRERLGVLERECDAIGRDTTTMWRTLGLYALCGENEHDLARRWDRLCEQSPPGVTDGMTLQDFRSTRLVGTVDEIREQADEWDALGIDTLILGVGVVPFQVSVRDDVELLGHALGGS